MFKERIVVNLLLGGGVGLTVIFINGWQGDPLVWLQILTFVPGIALVAAGSGAEVPADLERGANTLGWGLIAIGVMASTVV